MVFGKDDAQAVVQLVLLDRNVQGFGWLWAYNAREHKRSTAVRIGKPILAPR